MTEEIKQEQLLTYVDAAITFYERVAGHQPDVKQVQQLLEVAGIHATLEHIKMCGDIALELRTKGEQETPSTGENGEAYINPYATQNKRDPAYWNRPEDIGPAHYNPNVGLEREEIEKEGE